MILTIILALAAAFLCVAAWAFSGVRTLRSDEMMAELNRARDDARRELAGQR